MSEKKPHPFDKLRGEAYRRERLAEAEEQYEESRVKFLVTRLNVPRIKWDILDRSFALTGVKRLTLPLFNAVAAFPVVLHCTRLGGVQLHLEPTCTVPAMFKGVSKLPFVKEFEDIAGDRDGADDRPTGLVFPRKGLQQGLVVHDGRLDSFCRDGMMWVINRGPKRLVVQPFASLVDAVKESGWLDTR